MEEEKVLNGFWISGSRHGSEIRWASFRSCKVGSVGSIIPLIRSNEVAFKLASLMNAEQEKRTAGPED